MPPEGDRAKDDDIWHLVNYVRSLAKKLRSAPMPQVRRTEARQASSLPEI
jgi:hypothetical protein